MKKSKKKNPKPKLKPKPQKYRKEFADKVKFLIVEAGMLNQRGEIAWQRIGRILGVSRRMMARWRDPLDPYYKKEFAQAVIEAEEAINADKIKRSMIHKASGYIRKHIVYEPVICEPDKKNKKSKMKVTKRETIEVSGDVQAAKLVLANIGPEEKRWKDKSEIAHTGTIKIEPVMFGEARKNENTD